MGAFENFALIPEQGAVPRKEQLPPDMQRDIEQLAARLNVRDGAAVMGFGAKAQKEMTAFSDIALRQMLQEDVAPLDSTMRALAEQIRACSFGARARGILRRAKLLRPWPKPQRAYRPECRRRKPPRPSARRF